MGRNDTTTPAETPTPAEARGAAELLAQVEPIIGCVPDGVLVYDADGRIVRANAAADAILGYDERERGMTIGERLAASAISWHREDGTLVTPEDSPPLRAAKYGETFRDVVLRIRRGGRDRWLSVSAAPLLVRGVQVGAVVSLTDTTDRKRREANQALLAAIGDDFARLSTEEEITKAIGARLMEHLGISDCSVADFAGDVATIRSAFTSHPATAPLPPSTLKVSEYLSEELEAAARAGHTVVIRDARTDRRVDARQRYDALGVRACVIVPFLGGGEWRHSFAVATSEPRDWRDDEIQLVQEVAARYFPRIERARAEEALRTEERRYRSLFENSLDAVYLARADGTILDANPAACRMHQMTVQEIKERGRKGLVVNDERHAAALRERARAGHVRAEFTDLRKDGTRFPVEVESVIVDSAEGTAFVIARDITERKRAEAALRESEERLRALADSMPQLAWTAQPDGYITWYNRRWYEYTGTAPEQMEGWGWQSVHDPATLPGVMRRWKESIASGADFEMEFPLRGADGRFRRFLTRVFPLKDPAGKVLQWFGTNTDVTELVEAQEALREADRRKDEFLGMLSHELRNPLAPIRNALYILDRAEPNGQQARRAKEIANRQIGHLTRLVDDLLDVTRIGRGKIDLRRTHLDLAALARRTADDHRALMQDRDLELVVDVPDQPVFVSGDETRLAQVLGNLLHNAAKFTPAGGRVVLTLSAEEAKAVIHVRDTGTGIDPEMMRTIFEPFTQGKQTLARSEGGLGLGLALVKGLVTLHGGEVSASSSRPGPGSEFIVTLPLAAPSETTPGEQVAPRGVASVRRRVLVIDDNRDAADSLAQYVSMLGHTADIAYDGLAALAKAAEDMPDVVLCDIGLPRMDGYEFARRFRALSSSHPVRLVAVSGYAQPEDVAKAIEAGFDAHVAKPPDLDQLAGLLA